MIEDYIFKKQQKHSMVIRDNMSPCPEIIICDFSYENLSTSFVTDSQRFTEWD